jgi:methylenetetrahydrofolate reductase (NADH)
MATVFRNSEYIIELLTPKQSDKDFEGKLQQFAQHYQRILDQGATVSICDNPLGNLHFTAMEVIGYMDLPFSSERTLLHLNSFHRKTDLDLFLQEAKKHGLKYLLLITGDGGHGLPRLESKEMGFDTKAVTSVELLNYVEREYPKTFICGVAFNQYEPRDYEWEKLKRKLAAGAKFVITQPVMGSNEVVDDLHDQGVRVFVGAWMSKRIDPLCECIGVKKVESPFYDPGENLSRIHIDYPDYGIYLSQLSFKLEWNPFLTRKNARN